MPDIKPSNRAQIHGGAKRSRDGLGYRCGKCGQLKAGHVCAAVADEGDVETVVLQAQAVHEEPMETVQAQPVHEEQATADRGARVLRPPRPNPQATARIRIGRGHQADIPEWPHGDAPVVHLEADPVTDNERDAASAVSALAAWPPTDDIYLDLLRRYDLRPSELDALRLAADNTAPPQEPDDSLIVHIVERDALCEAARVYADSVVFAKKHHEDALRKPASAAALLLVVPAAAQPPYTSARAILLYTRGRRGTVEIVHTRDNWCRRGYALRLARAVQEQVPCRGSLTVDSPGCTARAAVSLWLRARFMGDEELLKCELADDAAYMGGRSVRLGFAWQKNATPADEHARIRFLDKVARKHPELAGVCRSARAAQ